MACGSNEGPSEPPVATQVPKQPATSDPEPTEPQPPTLECIKQPFAESLKLPEASAATQLPEGLLVIADSGHRGSYELLDPNAGTVLETGRLPLPGDIRDDIEGAATTGNRVVAITSSGVVLEYTRTKSGFELRADYEVAPPIPGCSKRGSNCGMNWEGLCLGETKVAGLSGCVGAAVSKRRGSLVCLERNDDGELHINSKKSIEVAKRGLLSGCSIASGSVWVVSNALGANAIHHISEAGHARFKPWVAASLEAIAAINVSDDGITLLAFSDTNRGPSRAFRYRCTKSDNKPG